MKQKNTLLIGLITSIGIAALILDSRTALSGAAEGIDLCIRTVIPSLFPFFIFSILLTGSVLGNRLPILDRVGQLCGIPSGTESIFLVGLLGGYPVGAQCISRAYTAGQLSRTDAQRMLGFCNNAGPAFLFGMIGSQFQSHSTAFVLWFIHIISALIVGILLPKSNNHSTSIISAVPVNIGHALRQSIQAMANVCGWVVLFRVVLCFAQRWFLWLLPSAGQVLLTGILELSNGCLELAAIEDEAVRFVLVSIFLGFGGICVGMQTLSVVEEAGLDSGMYFPGKVLQTSISAILTIPLSHFLFTHCVGISNLMMVLPAVSILATLALLKNRKNNSSIPVATGV